MNARNPIDGAAAATIVTTDKHRLCNQTHIRTYIRRIYRLPYPLFPVQQIIPFPWHTCKRCFCLRRRRRRWWDGDDPARYISQYNPWCETNVLLPIETWHFILLREKVSNYSYVYVYAALRVGWIERGVERNLPLSAHNSNGRISVPTSSFSPYVAQLIGASVCKLYSNVRSLSLPTSASASIC